MAKINKGLLTSNTAEYETPDHIFQVLDQAFNFSLDAAASPKNAKCEKYYTADDNSLDLPWHDHAERNGGAVWLNPPYGRQIKAFMEKAYNEYLNGATVVCLVPARTDTAWWHDYAMKGQVLFIRGRLKFKPGSTSAPFPSAIVIFDSLASSNITKLKSFIF